MKTVKHEIKLERSVKIILGVLAVGVLLNAFTIGDIISSAEARHNANNTAYGEGSMHVTIDNWPQQIKKLNRKEETCRQLNMKSSWKNL